MPAFMKIYGALILATISLLQPWIMALWKKLFRKGKLHIHETGTIEVSYGPVGPVLNLYGTMRAIHKSVFVKSMDLLVIREKDKSQHEFKWLAFRSPLSDLSSQQHISPEIPYSFMVSPSSPHRYNIVFADIDLYNEIKPQFNMYITEWYKAVERLKKKLPFAEQANLPPDVIKEIDEFRKSKIQIDTYALLERKCFWEPGDYSLNLFVRTSKPDQTFTKVYRFSLGEEDFDNLKLNVITILEEPISSFFKRKNYPYYYVYTKYK